MTRPSFHQSLRLAALVLGTGALASASETVQPAFDLSSPRSTPVTQVADDGTVWALGRGWKAHFEPGALEFRALPAPGTAPTTARFRLESVEVGPHALAFDHDAAPALEGERVVYARGPLVETYDLGALGVEQSFVFDALPPEGDLVIRIAVEGDACGRRDEVGLVFESTRPASIRYGDVLVLDAAGRTFARPSEHSEGGIVLRVPRSFLASATFPLVVDPLISVQEVDTGADVTRDPDVAFDSSSGRWLVVYEQISGDEGDILSRRFDFYGNVIEEVAVDITNDDTVDPAVANNNASNQFLIVWTKLPGFLGLTQKIRGRTRVATSTVQGTAFNVTSVSANEERPDVGGSPNAGDNKYLVTWDTSLGSNGANIRARTVTTSGSLGSILDIDTDASSQIFPNVTKSCGPAGVWGIAYQGVGEDFESLPILLAFVDRTGAVLATKLEADLSGVHSDAFVANIAGDGRVFGVTWLEAVGNDTNVIGSFFAFQNGVLSGLAGTLDLSVIEPGATPTRKQFPGGIETDGLRFTYSYLEQRANSSDFDVFAATIDPVTGVFVEGHVLIAASIFLDGPPAIASTFGSGRELPSRCFLTWDRQPAGADFDVQSALYAQP